MDNVRDDTPLQDVCPVLWCLPPARTVSNPWGVQHVRRADHFTLPPWLAQRHGTRLLHAVVACSDASHAAAHVLFVTDALNAAIPLPPAVLDAVIAWGGLTPAHWSNMVSRIQAAYGPQCVEGILSRLDAGAVTQIVYDWMVGGVGGPAGREREGGGLPIYAALAGHSNDNAGAVAAVQRVWAARRLPPLALHFGVHPIVWRSWPRLVAWLDAEFIAPPPASTLTLGVELGEPLRNTENTEALTAWWRLRALLPITERGTYDDAPDHPAWRECVRMLAWHGVPAAVTWAETMDAVARATAVTGWENAVLEYLSGWRCNARFKTSGDVPCAPPYNCALSIAECYMRAASWFFDLPLPLKGLSGAARRWAAQQAANASDVSVARELSWVKRRALVTLRAALRPANGDDNA